MKNLNRIVVAGLIAIGTVSCGDSGTDKKSEEVNTETKTEAKVEEAEVEEEVKTMENSMVLNANLATEDDFKGLGLSEEVIKQIMEARPFNDMASFSALLGDDAASMFDKVFVPLNLNTTAEDDFKIIPGVGDKMAHEFEEYRPYTSVEQFKREIGKYVDQEEVDRYLNYVFVPVELNTATEKDIKALPGVGDKMAHEFEEYRPYKSMEQFRKEISKYVDDKELKRLERLVYLKQ